MSNSFKNIILNYKKQIKATQKSNELLKKKFLKRSKEASIVQSTYEHKILNDITLINELTTELCEVRKKLRAFWNICKNEIEKVGENLTPALIKITNHMENMTIASPSKRRKRHHQQNNLEARKSNLN